MRIEPTGLPVEAALPALCAVLQTQGRAVLTAPPGAGKTTLVPLALLDEPWATGRILMLEPRRLAARAAADRMASLLGERSGETVGFRIRGEAKVSAATRIEVVTEGILTRMLQDDPELSGVSAVVFDEFHERSLNADLGLALTWEARGALREDLRIVVMSATLDAGPVAAMMDDAPIVSSDGRAFPVDTIWLDAPWRSGFRRMEDAVAALIGKAMGEQDGDALVFLPGVGEIERVRRALSGRLGATAAEVHSLHGTMPFKDQRAALAPAKGRKIVLATAIAETSLTVEGVRIVVDAGLSRRARFDAGAGMSRLVTERASKAEADQRRGRAGRVAPGTCYRLWTKGEEGAMAGFAPPEIEVADLAPLALELANWGAQAGDLAFLTPPPEGAMAEAVSLLVQLGALDSARTGGGITAHGRKLAMAPTHPRLAHMILTSPKGAGLTACRLAALLEDRDPLRGAGADIASRLRALSGGGGPPQAQGALKRIGAEATRLARRLEVIGEGGDAGALIARAFPDRIGLRRSGDAPRFLLSGGKGARLADDDGLAGQHLLAVADIDGADGREAVIRLAAPLAMSDLEDLFGERIEWRDVCEWSRRERKVIARQRRMLGALVLDDRIWRDAEPEVVAAALIDGVRDLGIGALPWTPAARRVQARVEWARSEMARSEMERAGGADVPDLSDAGLLDDLHHWLAPHLTGLSSGTDLGQLDMAALLRDALGWAGGQAVDRAAPSHFTAPTGTKVPIDYGGSTPSAAVRLQELFGLNAHPVVAGKPLLLELLSPAGRPVQMTTDLPGFWQSSYSDVRKDMRGRYPRHPWPEDPANAEPTRRVKPRRT